MRPQPIVFIFDGTAIEAYPGETVAAALIASGIHDFRRDMCAEPRGPYCNMGTCFECVLEVRDPDAVGEVQNGDAADRWHTVRGCLMRVRAGLEVRSIRTPGIRGLST
jgi:sarcosine oxidase subunit alpha